MTTSCSVDLFARVRRLAEGLAVLVVMFAMNSAIARDLGGSQRTQHRIEERIRFHAALTSATGTACPKLAPNLGMPSMTIVFQVKDPAMLDDVKTGDNVRFAAEKSDHGFVVTSFEATK